MNTKELTKQRVAAMPEVKALVSKYGRRVIGSCLTRIREVEKGAKELEKMKRQVAELEKRLSS